MQPACFLISQPSVDFKKFLALSHEALGYSLAKSSDAARRDLSDSERFISCLNALTDQSSPAGLSPHLLSHITFSVLVAIDDRELLTLLQATGGMPFVSSDTKARGIQIAVITGTLAKWRDAVISGTQKGGSVQQAYCKIHDLFVSVGLNVWNDCVRKGLGPVFYLEHHV